MEVISQNLLPAGESGTQETPLHILEKKISHFQEFLERFPLVAVPYKSSSFFYPNFFFLNIFLFTKKQIL